MADPETPDPVSPDPLMPQHISIQEVRLGPADLTQAIVCQIYDQSLITGCLLTSLDDLTYELRLQPDVQFWGLVTVCWPQCTAMAEWNVPIPGALADYPHVHVIYTQRGHLFRDCLIDPGALEGLIWDLVAVDGAERWERLQAYSELYGIFWQDHIDDLPQLFLTD